MPSRSAKRDTRPFSFLPMNGNRACSCFRSIQRTKCTPHTWSGASEKRSWERGMRISAVHPRESTVVAASRSEEHTSELQSPYDLVCRLLLEKKKQHRAVIVVVLHPRASVATVD